MFAISMFFMLVMFSMLRYYLGAVMDHREELQKRIEKKRRDLEKLEAEVRDGRAYLRALEDTFRLLEGDGDEENTAASLRPGSDIARSETIIRTAGRPLHITDILKALGKPPDKRNKESLSSSLYSYAKKGQVFAKFGPNIFGLAEMPKLKEQAGNGEPPDDFGAEEPAVDATEVPF
jgi:hypothetical protein